MLNVWQPPHLYVFLIVMDLSLFVMSFITVLENTTCVTVHQRQTVVLVILNVLHMFKIQESTVVLFQPDLGCL